MFKKLKRLRQYNRIRKAADKLLDGIEDHGKENQLKFNKSIFKSKTFWVNILALLNELLKILPLNPSLQNATIPTEVIAAGLPVANIILRRMTKVPVKVIPEALKPEKEDIE